MRIIFESSDELDEYVNKKIFGMVKSPKSLESYVILDKELLQNIITKLVLMNDYNCFNPFCGNDDGDKVVIDRKYIERIDLNHFINELKELLE